MILLDPKIGVVTVRPATGGAWRPVLVKPNAQGHEQVSDHRPAEEDPLEAKRVAVAWARELGTHFIPS